MTDIGKFAALDLSSVYEVTPVPFFRELSPTPYEFPESCVVFAADGTVDEVASLAALKAVVENFRSGGQDWEQFFVALGVDAATWPDFENRFAALRPDVVWLIEDTACQIATTLIASDGAVFSDPTVEVFEAGLRLKAASFLLPLVTVNKGDKSYGITPGDFQLAVRSSTCSMSSQESAGRRLLADLRLDLQTSLGLNANALYDDGRGLCYSTDPDLYDFYAGAGPDQVVLEPFESERSDATKSTVTLDATRSHSNLIGALRYQWREGTGTPPVTWLTSTSDARPVFRIPVIFKDETLRFEVSVSDSSGKTLKDEVEVRLLNANDAPSVKITAPDSVAQGQEFTAIARGEDNNAADELSFSWAASTVTGVRAYVGNAVSPVSRLSEVRITAPIIQGAKELRIETTVTDGHPVTHNGVGTAKKNIKLTAPVVIQREQKFDQLRQDASEIAKRTGGKFDHVGTQRRDALTPNTILKTLQIEGDKPKDFIPCFLIDGSGSMSIVADRLAATARQILEKSLSQVEPDGNVQIALYIYGNGETISLFWMSEPIANTPAGRAQLEKVIRDFESRAKEAANMIRQEQRDQETLWHSMGELMNGENKLPFKAGANRVQRIIALTDLEMDAPENVLISKSGKTWTKLDALAAATNLDVEFWPVLFGNEPLTLEDLLLYADLPGEYDRAAAAHGLIQYESDERARAALIRLSKDSSIVVRTTLIEAMMYSTRREFLPALLDMPMQDLGNVADQQRLVILWRLRADSGSQQLRQLIQARQHDANRYDWKLSLHVLAQIGNPDDFDYIAGLRETMAEQKDSQEFEVLVAMAIYAEASGDRRTLSHLKDFLCLDFTGGFFFGRSVDARYTEGALYALLALAEMAAEDDKFFLTTLLVQANPRCKETIRQIRNNLDLPPDKRKSTAALQAEIVEKFGSSKNDTDWQVLKRSDQIPEETP